jgi:hypothetical protein
MAAKCILAFVDQEGIDPLLQWPVRKGVAFIIFFVAILVPFDIRAALIFLTPSL